MSNNNDQDTIPQTPAGTAGDTPPARKRAARSVASQPAGTDGAPPAKKATARKAAAKKVAAKKVARKSAPSSTPELPFIEPPVSKPIPAPEDTPAPRPARPSRAKKIASEPASAEAQAPVSDEAPRRFGRVPGGGPVTHREPAEPRPPAPVASIPYPQQVAPPPDRENAPPAGPPREPERQDRPPQEDPQRNFQQRDPQQRDPQQRDGQGPPRESRSKKRREKRKRRNNERQEQQGPRGQQHQPNRHRNEGGGQHGPGNDFDDRRPVQLDGPKIEADGMLELAPKGFGFLRVQKKNFEQARDDVFVTPEMIRKYNLRLGQWIHGVYQDGPRGPQLVEITKINDMTPEEAAKLPHFDELKAINPTRRISFETTPERFTTRVVDIMAPVGRGQRGLIVSPPRSGKTTLLLHMAEAIREKYDEAIHLMVVLVDERPEEVTEFRRALQGAEIYASSNDEQARNHTRIAELAIERAKRLVEAGKDVFLIMDSITRLARAYNGNMNTRGRGTASGGLTIGALEVPRRLFAAARNTRGGGSLTIMATALIQTNSRADEAIYMEFKGTGNMELVLDRKIAENYIYPAVDIFKSGTRREELLLADHMLHKIHLIRRGLSGHRPAEAMERLLFFLKKFPNNPQMLMEIKG
ncbi:MAG: transcription termination factor Rho [Verrucomicrobiota bacterium]